MMGKTLEVPISLLRTIAFNFNVNSSFVNKGKLREDLAKIKSGYRGEKSINYFLYSVINKNYQVFHNARLSTRGQYFEIDVLLVTDRFLLIIEVKNHSGKISFDHEFGVMIQNTYGKEKVYQDPVNQVERQKRLLEIWLKERGYQVPVETLVCFVNKNTMIERQHHRVDPRIISGYKLSQVYEYLSENYQNHPPLISTEQLISALTKNSRPIDKSLLDKYGLTKQDFKPGVLCSSCLKKNMYRDTQKWICSVCNYSDTEAHFRALKDYFLIFGPKINNEEARKWLNETNPNYVKKILNRITTKKQGTGRNLVYYLDFDYQTDFDYLIEYLEKQFKRSENKI